MRCGCDGVKLPTGSVSCGGPCTAPGKRMHVYDLFHMCHHPAALDTPGARGSRTGFTPPVTLDQDNYITQTGTQEVRVSGRAMTVCAGHVR